VHKDLGLGAEIIILTKSPLLLHRVGEGVLTLKRFWQTIIDPESQEAVRHVQKRLQLHRKMGEAKGPETREMFLADMLYISGLVLYWLP
jgi:predicted ATPase